MSLRKHLARVLVAAVLQLGVLGGAPISVEEIEKIMSTMHRTKVVFVVKRDDPPSPG